MKRTVGWLIACVVMVGALFWWYESGRRERLREEKAKQAANESLRAKRADTDSRLNAMVRQHNALAGWEVALSRSTKDRELYSVDVEQRIFSKDHRPVLFFGMAEDIRTIEGKLVVRFEGDTGDLFYGERFYFELECDEGAANVIRAADFLTTFGVVASVSSLNVIDSKVTVGGDTERRREFLSRGRCLAVVPVDIDYMSTRDRAMGDSK